jgi:hypothetical protein
MIFKHLLLFYLDGDWRHWFNMLEELDVFYPKQAGKSALVPESFFNLTEALKKQPAPVVAYGAGLWAGFFLTFLKHKYINVNCLCDSNPKLTGTEKYGYNIKSFVPILEECFSFI